MFSVFMELVKRVGIFVIIGQTILHFGISKKYEKYMKLVISFMIGAQIIFAFGVYRGEEKEGIRMMSSEEYFEAWKLSMEEVEKKMEEYKENRIQNAWKQTLEEQALGMGNTDTNINDIKIEKIVIQ